VYGPNGFFRSFKLNNAQTNVETVLIYQNNQLAKNTLTGNGVFILKNNEVQNLRFVIEDLSYKTGKKIVEVAKGKSLTVTLDFSKSHAWYDFAVKIEGNNTFEQRYAGHIETGRESFTDPAMGQVI
jgi:phospholipase C